jgi:hypothetical protein
VRQTVSFGSRKQIWALERAGDNGLAFGPTATCS